MDFTISPVLEDLRLQIAAFVARELIPLEMDSSAYDPHENVREDVLGFLDKHNFQYVPSVSNCFMVDVKRPGMDVVMALRTEKVYIGRVWQTWPTHVRVTVGTQEEMSKFKAAFSRVMA